MANDNNEFSVKHKESLQLRFLKKLLGKMMDKDCGKPFIKLKKKQLDLKTIKSRIEKKQYSCAEDCIDDIYLVFKNADSSQIKIVTKLKKYFRIQINNIPKADYDRDLSIQKYDFKNTLQNKEITKLQMRIDKLYNEFQLSNAMNSNDYAQLSKSIDTLKLIYNDIQGNSQDSQMKKKIPETPKGSSSNKTLNIAARASTIEKKVSMCKKTNKATGIDLLLQNERICTSEPHVTEERKRLRDLAHKNRKKLANKINFTAAADIMRCFENSIGYNIRKK